MRTFTSSDDSADHLLPIGREWLGLGAVVLAHLSMLGSLSFVSKPSEPIALPTIVGVL
jgi:hypothetical protein